MSISGLSAAVPQSRGVPGLAAGHSFAARGLDRRLLRRRRRLRLCYFGAVLVQQLALFLPFSLGCWTAG